MTENKLSLKVMLDVDMKKFNQFKTEIASLSKSFKKVQDEIAASSSGMDKKIKEAFFGKGTQKRSIQKFFRDEFKQITKSFSEEIRNSSKEIIASASGMSGDTISKIASIILQQQKKIEQLSKNTKKKVSKAVHPVYGSLSKEDYGIKRDVNAIYTQQLEEQTYKKFLAKEKEKSIKEQLIQAKALKKQQLAAEKELNKQSSSNTVKLSDDDKAFRKYYLEYKREKINNKLNEIKQEQQAFNTLSKLRGNEKLNEIKQEQQAFNTLSKLRGNDLISQVETERKSDQNLRKWKKKQEAIEKATEKRITEEKYRETELRLNAERQYNQMVNAERAANTESIKKPFLDLGEALGFTMTSNNPYTQIYEGLSKSVNGVTAAATRAIGIFKELAKYAVGFGVAGAASFLGFYGIVQKMASGVVFATEKLRGYEIALFGMMKTQDGVNKLMEKAFKVTKNLPISYEQVYQSTKALTLIGPVRDMLKNVGETETVLKRMYSITMALSQIEPEWGLAGAQFSLREALSGDLRSLQRRFEIPVNVIYSKDGRSLRDLKNDPEAMSQALSDYFKEFYNEETLGMAANQFGAIISKIEGIWFKFQTAIGNSGFYDMIVNRLKELRTELETFAESTDFTKLANSISNSMGSSFNSILSIIEKLVATFGKFVGIDTELVGTIKGITGAFELFAGVLRYMDKALSNENFIKAMSDSLKSASKWINIIYVEAKDLFRLIKEDATLVLNLLREFPKLSLNLSDTSKRGLLYTMLFGLGNIGDIIGGVFMVLSGSVTAFGTLLTATLSAANLMGKELVASILTIGVKIGGVVLIIEESIGIIRFAFDSISDGLESSAFYKIYLWMTGQTTNDAMMEKFNIMAKQFNASVGLFEKTSPVESVTFASSLAKVSGLSEDKITNGMRKDSGSFLASFVKRENGVTQLTDAIEQMAFIATKMDETDPRRAQMERTTAVLDAIVRDISKIDLTKISSNYQIEGNKLDKYDKSDKFYGLVNEFSKGIDSASGALKPFADVISNYLTPELKKAESALLAARAGDIVKRGDSAITELTPEAKVGAASMLNFFKSQGYTASITSGYRKEDINSTHSKGLSADFQLKSGGKYLGATELQSPKMQAMVKAMQANPMIEKLLLESPDTSIFGDVYDKKLIKASAKTNNGPHMHIQWKKNLEEKANLIAEATDSTNQMYLDVVSFFPDLMKEINTPSPQLAKSDPLKQANQRATEFMTNLYMPILNSMKEGYGTISEIMAGESGFSGSEELFKGLEDDGVSKAGPRAINKIRKDSESKIAIYKEWLKDSGGIDNAINEIVSQHNSLIASALANGEDPIKLFTRMGDAVNKAKNYLQINKEATNKNLVRQELANQAIWRQTVEKKSFDFVDIIGDDINTIRQNLMTDMLAESATKVAYDSKLESEFAQPAFEKAISEILTKMKVHGMSFAEAATGVEINNEQAKKAMELTGKTFENVRGQNLEYQVQKTLIESNVNSLKRVNNLQQLIAAEAQYSTTKAQRSEYYSKFETLLGEGQSGDYGSIFTAGIKSSQNEFSTTAQLMYQSGKELNDNLVKTFEDGFFNLMSGKIKNLGDAFSEVGNVIKSTILGIIAKMAAISMTKLVLGIDINGGISGGSSGGGLLTSLVGGLFGGGSSSNLGSTLLGNFGLGAIGSASKSSGGSSTTGNILNTVKNISSGNFDIGSLLQGGANAAIATKSASGLLSGTKLGGMLDSAKNFISTNAVPLLGAAAVATFLTQPGRLFGGTKDKTGDAQAALSDYTARRNASISRRSTDALNYYMGDNQLSSYEFGGIGYSTWSSGDGWFKGPKEKHAATDPSAYLESLKKYYVELLNAGKLHYDSMKNINKTAEVNQLRSLKMQYSFDQKKLAMIEAEYNKHAADSYTANDKYEKMDEFRDTMLEAEYSNWEMEQEMQKLQKETVYKQMEYATYMLSNGENQIAASKTAIQIEKMKMAEYEKYSLEWYDAKLTLMQSEKELADNLKEISKQMTSAVSSAAVSFYKQGGGANAYGASNFVAGLLNDKAAFQSGNYDERKILQYAQKVGTIETMVSGAEINERTINDMQNGSGLRINQRLLDPQEMFVELQTVYSLGINEIIENIDNYISAFTEQHSNRMEMLKTRDTIKDLLDNIDNTVSDKYDSLKELSQYYKDDALMSDLDKSTAQSALDLDITNFYSGLATDVNSWIKQGYMSKEYSIIQSFGDAISGGLNDASLALYNSMKKQTLNLSTKGNVLSTIKDMEDFSMFNQVMASDDMAAMRNILSPIMPRLNAQPTLNADGTYSSGINGSISSNPFAQYEDPYTAWFEFNKAQIKTRISNTQEGSAEWYTAQNELFNLMIENAEHLKTKAEEMTRSIEDMLGKIEETMRMRIAEERETAKGDVYFVDVGSTRDSQKMLDKMLAAVKTGDPEAMKLIEEFRKKMVGIKG